ncbi:MAG: hypothetical protein DRP74_00220 [Candidatus Omnitrophota bacterium]|nr:MAG: hypothetical protein DRP74_00220 [Candidatus Omnitrophota bacterium]
MILKRAFLYSGLVILFLVIFLPGFSKLQDLRDRNKELEDRIKQLKVENTLLNTELKRLERDPLYQEKIIREKMGLVRKGEVPVKIIPEVE